jgi:hypothetical protein
LDSVISYVSDVIGRRLEKVRNGHRFENLKKDINLRIERRFDHLKGEKRRKKDIDLRYICLLRRNQKWI